MLTSFLGWVFNTLKTAAEAEMNDDTALREQLLETEMRREMGEITEEEFVEIEADLLARIREIRARREGGSGPLTIGAQPIETTGDSTFQVEATVSGDFYEPSDAPQTTIIETEPDYMEEIHVGRTTAPQRASAPGTPPSGSPARTRQGSRHRKPGSRRTLRKS
jgi:hypothetical protein